MIVVFPDHTHLLFLAQFVDNYLYNSLMTVLMETGTLLGMAPGYGLSKSGGWLYAVQLVVVPPKLNLAPHLSVLLSSCKICTKNELV